MYYFLFSMILNFYPLKWWYSNDLHFITLFLFEHALDLICNKNNSFLSVSLLSMIKNSKKKLIKLNFILYCMEQKSFQNDDHLIKINRKLILNNVETL